MRTSVNISFPHPVVGNGDDAAGNFSPKLVRRNDRETLTLQVSELDTENEVLRSLIAEQRAEYVVRVECGASGYRRCFSTKGRSLEIKIQLSELYQEIEVEAGVVATQAIRDYRPASLHLDYGDATFNIEEGDILAVAPGWRLSITTEWDPLRAPVASIMQIVKDVEPEGPADVVLTTNKIQLRVSQNDYEQYLLRKSIAGDLLHATLVFPALVYALSKLEDSERSGDTDDISQKKWAIRVRELLKAKDLEDKDPFTAAQYLIDLPISRSFGRLAELLRGESDV